MMLSELQNARFVTRYYHSLQGLVLVPLGLYLVLFGIGNLLGWPGFRQGDCTLPTIVFPVALILTFAAARYYRKRFGEVRRTTSARETWATVAGVVGWCLLAIADMTLLGNIPFSFSVLGVALFCIMIPIASEGRRRHYYVLAAALVVFAFFPTFNILSKLDLFSGRWLGNLALGVMLVAGGLFDHWLLVRAFARARETQS